MWVLRINGSSTAEQVGPPQNTSMQQEKNSLEQENEGSKGQLPREMGEFYKLQRMEDSPPKFWSFSFWYVM